MRTPHPEKLPLLLLNPESYRNIFHSSARSTLLDIAFWPLNINCFRNSPLVCNSDLGCCVVADWFALSVTHRVRASPLIDVHLMMMRHSLKTMHGPVAKNSLTTSSSRLVLIVIRLGPIPADGSLYPPYMRPRECPRVRSRAATPRMISSHAVDRRPLAFSLYFRETETDFKSKGASGVHI